MTGARPPCIGRHLLADLYGCSRLDDVELIDRALRDAAAAAGATLLALKLHPFGPGQGVTGVALLAESHISIHSWPEHDYAAIDIFLCGERHNLDAALAVIARALGAERVEQRLIERGAAPASSDRANRGCDEPTGRNTPVIQKVAL